MAFTGSRSTRSAILVALLISGPPLFDPALAYDGPVYNAVDARSPVLGWSREVAVRSNRVVLTPSRMEFVLAVENYGRRELATTMLLPFEPVTRAHKDNFSVLGSMETAPFSAAASVDGLAIEGRFHLAARHEGIAVTQDLREAGLPLNPAASDWETADAGRLAPLRRLGAIGPWGPAWMLDVTWQWPMTIPPRATAQVAVSFTPVFGTWTESFLDIGGVIGIGIDAVPIKELCLTGRQIDRIRTLYGQGNRPPEGKGYVIHDFKLTMSPPTASFGSLAGLDFTIRPEREGDMVSACGGHFEEQEDGSLRWLEKIAHDYGAIRIFHLELEANRDKAGR